MSLLERENEVAFLLCYTVFRTSGVIKICNTHLSEGRKKSKQIQCFVCLNNQTLEQSTFKQSNIPYLRAMLKFLRLLRYIKPYKGWAAGHILSTLLLAVFSVAAFPILIPFLKILFGYEEGQSVTQPEAAFSSANYEQWLNYWLGQYVEQYGTETTLAYLCGGIIFIFFGKNLFRYLALFFLAPMRNGVVRDIRQDLFEKVNSLPLAYFSEERKGDIISRITADVQEIEWSILNVLETLLREPLLILGSLGFMLFVSPSLTLFVFVLIIFTGVVIGSVGRVLRKHSWAIQEKLGQLVSQVEEALSGLRITKGFTAEKYQAEKFGKTNNDFRWLLTRLLWRKDLASPLTEFLGIVTFSILIWYGYRQIAGGELSVETFFAFLTAFFMILEPAKKFSSASYNIQKGMAAVERVNQILDAKNTIAEKTQTLDIQEFSEAIEYKKVGFAYVNSERPVLQNINLKIGRGKLIALVGESGAGKSTLADLLPRFYDVSEGQILLDGQDIRDYKLQDLRRLMGIVSQEAILFNDTIYNNIVFGMEGVTEAQVIAAAKVANAHEFILETPEGYQTNIGDRGSKLSGGQRQRLTIARAVLKNPPILILDEATSALDSKSEKLVQKALEKLMENRTSIVIAHRLSTIQNADEIIVMEEGKIIERGTHEQLLSQGGTYEKLVQLQGLS